MNRPSSGGGGDGRGTEASCGGERGRTVRPASAEQTRSGPHRRYPSNTRSIETYSVILGFVAMSAGSEWVSTREASARLGVGLRTL